MTTSSELVLPSPSKMRSRKSRHRRNNSRGSLKDATSPARSPSHESCHGGKSVDNQSGSGLHQAENKYHPTYSSTFRYLGPGMAIKEQQNEDDAEDGHRKQSSSRKSEQKLNSLCSKNSTSSSHGSQGVRLSENCKQDNVNEVCCGCDGGCSDATCSSKRSSQTSADVESACDPSPLQSPRHPLLESMNEKTSPEVDTSSRLDTGSGSCSCSPMASPAELQLNTQTNPVREKDSNENLNCSTITSDNCETSDLTTSMQQQNQQQITTNTGCCTTSDAINTSFSKNISNPANNSPVLQGETMRSGLKRGHSSQDISEKENQNPYRRQNSDVLKVPGYDNGNENDVSGMTSDVNSGNTYLTRGTGTEDTEQQTHNLSSAFRKTKVSNFLLGIFTDSDFLCVLISFGEECWSCSFLLRH